MSIRVEVRRGGTLESEHVVEGAVVDAAGRVLAATERPDRVTFFRSSAKPFQALPFVERGHFDALGLGDRHLALMCASHNGEPAHVETAREILDAVGRDVSDLECGFHFPEHVASADVLRGRDPSEWTALHHNCSGKHAGMVALCVREGWPVRGYTQPDHPLQQLLRRTIAEECGVDEATTPFAIDGCSASIAAVPLLAMARGWARFAAALPAAADVRERSRARIRRAMAAEPWHVAGTGRFCTDFMRTLAGRAVTKVGAEGLQCAAFPGRGLGVVVKAVDGARRATAPALVGWLAALGLVTREEAAALAEYAAPPVPNYRGLVVGDVMATSFPAWREEAVASIAPGGVRP